MPHEIRFTSTGAEIRYGGGVTASEVATALATTGRHAYPGGRRFLLVDLADADLAALTEDDVRALALRSAALVPTDRPVATAVVAPQDAAYALGRVWAEHAGDRALRIRILRTRGMALAWLGSAGVPAEELDVLAGSPEHAD